MPTAPMRGDRAAYAVVAVLGALMLAGAVRGLVALLSLGMLALIPVAGGTAAGVASAGLGVLAAAVEAGLIVWVAVAGAYPEEPVPPKATALLVVALGLGGWLASFLAMAAMPMVVNLYVDSGEIGAYYLPMQPFNLLGGVIRTLGLVTAFGLAFNRAQRAQEEP